MKKLFLLWCLLSSLELLRAAELPLETPSCDDEKWAYLLKEYDDDSGQIPLIFEAGCGNFKKVKEFLDNVPEDYVKQQLLHRDVYGRNVLMHTANSPWRDEVEIFEKVLCKARSLGINIQDYIESKDKDGRTALVLAIRSKNTALVEFLLDQGADFLYQRGKEEDYAYTPLLDAVYVKSVPIVELLLSRGERAYQLSLTNGDGFTPLLLACAYDDPSLEVIQVLIDAGSDPSIKSLRGNTSLIMIEELMRRCIARPLHYSAVDVKELKQIAKLLDPSWVSLPKKSQPSSLKASIYSFLSTKEGKLFAVAVLGTTGYMLWSSGAVVSAFLYSKTLQEGSSFGDGSPPPNQ